jgi:hypothetical protein
MDGPKGKELASGQGWAWFGFAGRGYGGLGALSIPTYDNLYRVISVWRSPSNSNAAMSVSAALSSIFSGTPEAALDSFTQSTRSKYSFIMKVTLGRQVSISPLAPETWVVGDA